MPGALLSGKLKQAIVLLLSDRLCSQQLSNVQRDLQEAIPFRAQEVSRSV